MASRRPPPSPCCPASGLPRRGVFSGQKHDPRQKKEAGTPQPLLFGKCVPRRGAFFRQKTRTHKKNYMYLKKKGAPGSLSRPRDPSRSTRAVIPDPGVCRGSRIADLEGDSCKIEGRRVPGRASTFFGLQGGVPPSADPSGLAPDPSGLAPDPSGLASGLAPEPSGRALGAWPGLAGPGWSQYALCAPLEPWLEPFRLGPSPKGVQK